MGTKHTRGTTLANKFAEFGRILRFLLTTEDTWPASVTASQHARIVKEQALAVDVASAWTHAADIPIES